MEGTIAEHTHQVAKNLRVVIEAAGSSLDDVVNLTDFLDDMKNFQEVKSVYAEYFASHFPARSAIHTAALTPGADIEIEAIVLSKLS